MCGKAEVREVSLVFRIRVGIFSRRQVRRLVHLLLTYYYVVLERTTLFQVSRYVIIVRTFTDAHVSVSSMRSAFERYEKWRFITCERRLLWKGWIWRYGPWGQNDEARSQRSSFLLCPTRIKEKKILASRMEMVDPYWEQKAYLNFKLADGVS